MLTKRRKQIPIFNYWMNILIFDDWEDLKGYIPDDVYTEPSKGVTINYGPYCIVCCNPQQKSTVVHESGHIANMVWKYIGYEPMRDNDEVDQYLTTYIYEEIMKVIDKHLEK